MSNPHGEHDDADAIERAESLRTAAPVTVTTETQTVLKLSTTQDPT